MACYFLEAKTKDPAWLKLAATYDTEYQAAFQTLKMLDIKKFGIANRVRDIYESSQLDVNTDWDLGRDSGF